MRVAAPPEVMRRDGSEVRVRFAGVVDFVADARARQIRAEAHRRHGEPPVALGDFDLHRPLARPHWIAAFVERWLDRHEPGASENDRLLLWDWLEAELLAGLCRMGLLSLLRRRLRRALRDAGLVPPEVARLAPLAEPPARATALPSQACTRVWRELDTLARIERETPTLLHLYLLARREAALAPGAGVDELKRQMRRRGVTRLGWTLLCRHGRALYRGVLRSRDVRPTLAAIAAHVRLFQQVDGERCPPPALQRAFYLADYLPVEEIDVVPAGFVRRAWDELERQQAAGTAEVFIRNEFLPVLWWLREEQPAFDKQQRRAGWRFWVNARARWHDEHFGRGGDWSNDLALPRIDGTDHVAVAITNTRELIAEGAAMHHCAADRDDRCRQGGYLVYSIRHRADGRRAATLGLERTAEGWQVDQVVGHANAGVGTAMRRFAAQVAEAVNAACQVTPRHHQPTSEAAAATT